MVLMGRPAAHDRAQRLRHRRSPPDYTRRSVKLKLFLFVAAIMVVLAAVERLRDKQMSEWLAKIDHRGRRDTFSNRLDAAARTINDPAGTFVATAEPQSNESPAADVDPVQRAWD